MKLKFLTTLTAALFFHDALATEITYEDSNNGEYWVYKVSNNIRGQKSENLIAYLAMTNQLHKKMIARKPFSKEDLEFTINNRKLPTTKSLWEFTSMSLSSASCIVDIVDAIAVVGDVDCKTIGIGYSSKSETNDARYHVDTKTEITSSETIEVGTRTFKALRIMTKAEYFKQNDNNRKSAEDIHQKENIAATISTEYWYVPELHGMAKTIRTVSANGFLVSQKIEDLVFFE